MFIEIACYISRMLTAIAFGVCIVAYGIGIDGKSITAKNEVKLPCYFSTYDVDANGEISADEFLVVAGNFNQMDPKTVFKRLDTNGDGKIVKDEIANMDSSLNESGIFDHCKRLRCCVICVICIG